MRRPTDCVCGPTQRVCWRTQRSQFSTIHLEFGCTHFPAEPICDHTHGVWLMDRKFAICLVSIFRNSNQPIATRQQLLASSHQPEKRDRRQVRAAPNTRHTNNKQNQQGRNNNKTKATKKANTANAHTQPQTNTRTCTVTRTHTYESAQPHSLRHEIVTLAHSEPTTLSEMRLSGMVFATSAFSSANRGTGTF